MQLLQLIHRWIGFLCLALLGACGGGSDEPSSPGTIQIESTLYDVREGAIVNIRVARLGGSSGDASVAFSTMNGTALGGTDYTSVNGTLTWSNGDSGNRTISIPIPDNSIAEYAKSFTLELNNVSGSTLGANSSAMVTIIDDDTTAVSAFGAITALGSATVNGIHYATSNSTVTANGQPAQVADLKLGQVVAINGDINFSNVTGKATAIDYSAMVIGPVENIEAPQKYLVVMGQSVYTNATTVFDPDINPDTYTGLSLGDTVEIYGFRNANGDIVATRLAPDTTSTSVQLIGTVYGPIVNATFNLHGLAVDYGSATQNSLPGGKPFIGQLVIVRGSLSGSVLIVNEIAGFTTASTIPGERTLLGGIVTRFTSAADFDLNGFAITTDTNTLFVGGAASNLAVDTQVIVDGEIIAGGNSVLAYGVYFNGLPSNRTVLMFDLDNFNHIVANGFLNLAVTQGSDFSVEVITNSRQSSGTQATQTNDTIFIEDTGSNTLISDVFVTLPVLNRIEIEPGSLANVIIQSFDQAQMIVNVDGVSLLRGNALNIDNLIATVSGVSRLNFGDINPIENAYIEISGVSQATLNMDIGSSMTGSVNTGQGTGHSILYYYGTNVTSNVSTDLLSEVVRLGDTKP